MTDASGEPLRVPDAELDYDEELIYTYNGQPFTGIGYEDDIERGLSEISYKDGLQDGPSRDWFASGRLKGETMYRENVRHDHNREYSEEGVMLLDETYEHGILVRSQRFDSHGNLIDQFEISDDSPNFERLQRMREQLGQ